MEKTRMILGTAVENVVQLFVTGPITIPMTLGISVAAMSELYENDEELFEPENFVTTCGKLYQKITDRSQWLPTVMLGNAIKGI